MISVERRREWQEIGKYLASRRLDTRGNNLNDQDAGNVYAIESGDWDFVSYGYMESHLEWIKIDIDLKELPLGD